MEKKPPIYEVKNGKLSAFILPSGDIDKIVYDQTMINMYPGTMLDGSLYNVYLKVEGQYTPLIGIESPSSFCIKQNQVVYRGEFSNVQYQVVFTIMEERWFIDVELYNEKQKEISIYYGLDVGLANSGINEAYNCQYIDHHIINHQGRIVILSKQNQGRPLLLETSSLETMDSYSTDGFQFFKKNYKFTNQAQAIRQDHLANENYQYEFAYLVLKSISCTTQKQHYTFYEQVTDQYHTFPPAEADFLSIKKQHEQIFPCSYQEESFSRLHLKYRFQNTLTGASLQKDEIDTLFPEKRNIQYDETNENILSFFTSNHEYVVLKELEKELERPSGMVFIGNGFKEITRSPFSVTTYIYGVFASHIVLGNTDFNSFTQESKTALNILKSQGLRIFVRIGPEYRLLTMPSYYQMSVNSAVWGYKIDDDLLVITTAIDYEENKIELEIHSKDQREYDFFISNSLQMGNAEPVTFVHDDQVDFYFHNSTMAGQKYPKLHYTYQAVNVPLQLKKDSFFFQEETDVHYPLMIHTIEHQKNVKILISADYDEKKVYNYEPISAIKDRYYTSFMKNISNISVYGNDSLAQKMTDLTVWYVHNALIHYASPHGLEQFSGAAWGCRDVCQGPVELFLTCGRFSLVRDILLKVYSRQFIHNYDWPQWFMFDEYANIQAEDSHGDIIVWPLKALSEYLTRSGDYSVLEEKVPYFDFYQGKLTTTCESIYQHVLHQLQAIRQSFIAPYHLSCYGGGDWDDTLQPKNKEQAKKMVSGWTIALTLDTLQNFIDNMTHSHYDVQDFKTMYQEMKDDFNRLIIKDQIPAGFIYFNQGQIEYILHPRDEKSHIRYRLLPLTRGMIAELYSKEQVDRYLSIIQNDLMYSDGVRLMSEAIQYRGGEKWLFNRAETAANFGREIGLQYVHAHIRYCEAMAKIGENKLLYEGLNKIIPIKIEDYVSNACIRQGNVYFSSSDGNFLNRYEACAHFDQLKTKEVQVKSGWRLYSSGPGIFLNQLYSHFLGISYLRDGLLIDPIMPDRMDGTVVKFTYQDKNFEVHYHLKNEKNQIQKVVIGQKVFDTYRKNRYRKEGIFIPQKDLQDSCKIDVYCE